MRYELIRLDGLADSQLIFGSQILFGEYEIFIVSSMIGGKGTKTHGFLVRLVPPDADIRVPSLAAYGHLLPEQTELIRGNLPHEV